MTRTTILLALLLSAVPAVAQRTPDLAALATGDAIAAEAARRKLITGPAAAVAVEVVVPLLRSADVSRRASAASVLLHHGLAVDAVVDWARTEHDARALVPVVDLLPRDALEEIVRTEYRPQVEVGEEMRLDHDPGLSTRVRAAGRLLDLGVADRELFALLLGSAQPGLARAAAELVVEEVWPFPTELLTNLSPTARRALLEALADRPRPESFVWAASLLEVEGLDPAVRLLAMLAGDPESWPRDAILGLLDRLVADSAELRVLAGRAVALLSSEQAERLVGEVHRRLLGDASLDDLLPALENIGERGEHHLLNLTRELTPRQRVAIVDWLATRGSPVVAAIVAEALDGSRPLDAPLLLRAGELLTTPARTERVLAIFRDEAAAPELRVAAFVALVGRGVVEEGMLDFALAPEPAGDPRSRVRQLLGMPSGALSGAEWRRLLEDAPHDVVDEVLGRMAQSPLVPGVEDTLLELAATGVGLADTAAHVALAAGSSELARAAWEVLDVPRRQSLAMSLRMRDEDWILPALRSTPVKEDDPGVSFARLAAGDRAVLTELLRDPAKWTARWLRRAEDAATALLEPADVPVVAAALARDELGADHRRELVTWLARRPDLPVGELLTRVHATDPDEEVRYAALRGLLRDPALAAPFRERVSQAIARGMDLEERDLAYEVIGALDPPLDAEAALLAARLALVAPLAHPEHELRTALREDPAAAAAMTNAVWQALGRRPPESLAAVLETAVAESLAHENAFAASRYRIGRFLALLARHDETLRVSAPVARAVLAAPDSDPSFVGPAHVVLGKAAEAAGDWARAAELWTAAAHGCLRTPAEPLVMRAFVGDAWRGGRRLPAAWLAARPYYCRARAALAAGDVDAARVEIASAKMRGTGDRVTEQEIERLEQELTR